MIHHFIRSVINAAGLSFPDHCVPELLFWTCVFSFPLHHCAVTWRIRSLLDNCFFLRSCVLEFRIKAKMIHFWWFRCVFLNLLKCVESHIHRRVSSRCWLYWISLEKGTCFLFMLSTPEFMISFILSQSGRNLVRTVTSRSWNNFTQLLSVHVKIYLLSNTLLSFLHLFNISIFFLHWFFKTISANSRRFSVFLLHFNSI